MLMLAVKSFFETVLTEVLKMKLAIYSVIFVNENENEIGEKRENNEFFNEN